MGAWGAGVFDDDLACEVREIYRDLLGDGVPAEQARDMTLQHWAGIIEDDDAAVVIWLALAVSQWKVGRLDDPTRSRAMAVIESGAALQAWKDDTKLLRRRQSVLEKVRRQLQSPQPPPVRLRKRFRDTCDWQRGELIAYRMQSGTNVVFRVVGHHTDRGGTSPVVEVLDCAGPEVPPADEMLRAPIRLGAPLLFGSTSQVFVGRMSERELPVDRVNRLGVQSIATQEVGGFLGARWKTLDRDLKDVFGIE